MNGYYLIAFVAAVPLAWYCSHRFIKSCEEANEADWGSPWLNRLDGLNRLFCRRYHRLECEIDPLPLQGGAIIVANHVSGLDPLLLIAAYRRPLRFMIAREQYERFWLTWLFRAVGCIPVDRRGRPDQALREALRVLGNGEVVAMFPHGKIHLDTDPPRKLKAGAVRLAHMTGCPVYPVRLDGIRGQGHTVLAVPLRSRARLRGFAPLQCQREDVDHCLRRVARLLTKHN